MKIVQLYDHFQERGGVERVISMLANGWRARGHDVAVVVRQGEVREVFPLDAGVRRHSLEASQPRSRLARWMRYGRDLWRLRRSPAIREADVVVANGPWCALLVLLAWRVRPLARRSPAIIVCDHNSPAAFGSATRFLMRRLYRRADAIVALTEQQAASYHTPASRVSIIPNPVELPGPAQWAQVATSTTVLAAGRLVPQKGYDLLLRAWRQAAAESPGHRLLIVGDGPERESLQRQAVELGISGSVTFAPATAELGAHFAAAKVFVLSSRYEGFGLVMLEALAHGLPVIAFDCEYGPRLLVHDGKNGRLCEPGNPAALAQALRDTLQDPPALAAMAAEARRSAQAYALPAVLDRWEPLLASVTPPTRG